MVRENGFWTVAPRVYFPPMSKCCFFTPCLCLSGLLCWKQTFTWSLSLPNGPKGPIAKGDLSAKDPSAGSGSGFFTYRSNWPFNCEMRHSGSGPWRFERWVSTEQTGPKSKKYKAALLGTSKRRLGRGRGKFINNSTPVYFAINNDTILWQNCGKYSRIKWESF